NYKEENILIDCGEGTQRQFRKAKLNPCKISRLLITHWHGDHVLGIPGLLQTLALSGYKKVIYIYGPRGTKKYIEEIIKIFKFVGKYEIKVEEILNKGKFFETSDFYLEAEQMEHGTPANAYNFVIKDKIRIDKKKLKKLKILEGPHLQQLKQGKDIIYQGKKYKSKELTYFEKGKKISVVLDTAMNPKIEGFVKDADLFVCESSFGSELEKEAGERMHMAVNQTANIAKKAKVKKLILTHISSRYEKNLNQILDEAKKIFKESYLVKDLDSLEV
ncbi:MAG: ribonuclease Z, partial [Nanoarchaeota archaeon]